MLRRTLILFIGFVLLVLAVTVGYAMLGLSGPRTAVADADRAIGVDKLAEAVRLLDIAERTLTAKEQNELLPEILRRRYVAHRKLGNVPAARRDVETLMQLTRGADDKTLAVDHLEILLEADEPESALAGATTALDTAGDAERPRLQEIAGLAHQAMYQRAIKQMRLTLEQALAPQAQSRAVAALKTLLYRPRDDQVAQRAEIHLREILRHEAAAPVSFDAFLTKIGDVRSGIEQAMALFRQCLESEYAEPEAAFRGLTFALEQGGYVDEKRAIEDLFLRRFDHGATVLAAISTTEAHFAAGRFAEATQVAQRFMPLGSALERAEQGRLLPEAKRLMVTHARALDALGDQASLSRLLADAQAVQGSGLLSMAPEHYLIACLAQRKDKAAAADHLRVLFWMLGQKGDVVSGLDLYEIAIELKLQILREHGDSKEVDATLDDWVKARPTDLRARRLRSEHSLSAGRPEAALADAAELLKHPSRDDETLALYVRAADEAAKVSGRDAVQLLLRLRARGVDTPTEPHDPALYLALGELALQRGVPTLAARCGHLAARSFAWAEWPSRLATEASLQLDPIEALRAAETYRQFHPDSATALQLYRKALDKLDRNEPELLFDLACRGIPDAALARNLLTAAIARDQRLLLPGLCQRVLYRYGRDAEATLLAARGMLVSNQQAAARDLLMSVPTTFPNDTAVCVEAATRFLLIEAKENPTSPLLRLAVLTLRFHANGDVETLTRVAGELEEAGQPEMVLSVLEPLLNDETHANKRNGRLYTLAGRASVALDKTSQAVVYLTQALAFDDGAGAAPSLALLQSLMNNRDAESALWQQEAVDEASACLLLTMRHADTAVRWARGRLRESSLDVTAMLILALSGNADDKKGVPNAFRVIAQSEGKAVLSTITLLAMPGFSMLGEKAARDLHRRLPTSAIAHFLYARALALIGKRDAAVTELTDLTQREPGFLPAYDEVLRITDGGLLGDISKIGPRISNGVMTAPNLATPRMRALVWTTLASQIGMANKDPAAALPLLAKLWIQFPQESHAGLESVAALITRGSADDAFELLRQLESQLPATERSRFLDFYFLLGARLGRADRSIEADLDAKARRLVEAKEPFGAAVHYLVDRLDATRGPLRRESGASAAIKEADDLLARHLEFVPGFLDRNVAWVMRSLDRLQQLESPDQLLTRIDTLLRRDPSLLDVWIRRAQLLVARGDVADALASLRWMSDYLNYAPAVLELARIGGLHDSLTREDLDWLGREVTPQLRERPDAALPLGLWAMREGRLNDAAALLAHAAPGPDGMSLYYAGMVALRQPDNAGAARQAFADFATRFPTSPRHEYARHLAAQIGCLEAAQRPPASPK